LLEVKEPKIPLFWTPTKVFSILVCQCDFQDLNQSAPCKSQFCLPHSKESIEQYSNYVYLFWVIPPCFGRLLVSKSFSYEGGEEKIQKFLPFLLGVKFDHGWYMSLQSHLPKFLLTPSSRFNLSSTKSFLVILNVHLVSNLICKVRHGPPHPRQAWIAHRVSSSLHLLLSKCTYKETN
jgi:hypothetical protein